MAETPWRVTADGEKQWRGADGNWYASQVRATLAGTPADPRLTAPDIPAAHPHKNPCRSAPHRCLGSRSGRRVRRGRRRLGDFHSFRHPRFRTRHRIGRGQRCEQDLEGRGTRGWGTSLPEVRGRPVHRQEVGGWQGRPRIAGSKNTSQVRHLRRSVHPRLRAWCRASPANRNTRWREPSSPGFCLSPVAALEATPKRRSSVTGASPS